MKPEAERYWRWENEINPKLCKEIIELAEDNWSKATTVGDSYLRKGKTFFTI